MNVAVRVWAGVILAGVGLVVSSGCNERPPIDGGPPVYPVSGTVTFKGAPMTGAIVTFYPLAPRGKFDAAPSATADAEGRYKLTTYQTGDGAPTGDYRVTVYWPGKRRGTPNEEGDLPPDQLKEVYANKKTSRLRATVAAQENAIDFKLPQ